MLGKKRLGDMLLEEGLIDGMQLQGALSRQKEWGGRLGENFVKLGSVSEITLLKFLGKQLGHPCADLSKFEIKPEVYKLISSQLAQKYKVIPLQVKKTEAQSVLFLAMSDPTNLMANDEIRFISGLLVDPVIATASQIENAIEKYYLNDEVQIRPLAEKVPTIDPEDMEIIHEVPLMERMELEKAKDSTIKNKEVMALITFLDEKGIIKKDECIKRVMALSKEGD